MSDGKIRRALIAVYDKTGIAGFARTLVDESGVEILSTGGTAAHLRQAGIPVTLVEEVTGFPEMLDGRVKTLHPMIHAGILADRDNAGHMSTLEKHGIRPIDMVVVNLYPFETTVADPGCTFEQAVEMIDIGGPCLLRAAAKNHRHVVVVSDVRSLPEVLDRLRRTGGVDEAFRRQLAAAAFERTEAYDRAVSAYLRQSAGAGAASATDSGAISGLLPDFLNLQLCRWQTARYGENPHQAGAVYRPAAAGRAREAAIPRARVLSSQPPSFNNCADGDAALSLVKELLWSRSGRHAAAFIKHANACGCAVGDDPVDAYRRAYLGDPVAAAGGVLCMSFPVTRAIADVVMNTFGTWGRAAGAAFFKLDVWIAPEFEEDAVRLITTPTEKRRWGAECRLLAVGAMDAPPDPDEPDCRKITGGLLVQTRDLVGLDEERWKVVTARRPTQAEMADLRFAWLVCKHTRSNAITVCREGMLLGSGAGQMSRVKSCDLAIQLARENGHGGRLAGAVAAGDAFFPVPDGPQKLIDAGITAIIQPGGGNRDAETVDLCDRAGVAMIMTGTRHFRH